MNAQLNTLQEQAQTLSESVTTPIIGSRKTYIEGSRPDIRVPMREIALTPTPKLFGGDERNAPFAVYDTSGPYTDHEVSIDLLKGLAPLRAPWIAERGDTELLTELLHGAAALGRHEGFEDVHDEKCPAIRTTVPARRRRRRSRRR